MRAGSHLLALIFVAGLSSILGAATSPAQTNIPAIALKNGESTELGTVWWVVNCRSIMLGTPEAEILEGPPGLTLSIKEAMVLPRRLNCATEVPGGILVATANNITEPVQGKLVYRIKYKTKDGDRQASALSLFP
jgi:hypothetical protein